MRLLQRLMAWVSALDPARRTRLLVATVIAVAAALGLSLWAAQETWVPVVSGQGYETALSAAAAVDKAGIPYRISAPDHLEVPRDEIGAARAAISAETKLPGLGEVGELRLGLTPQAQEWAFLRAAEGELAGMLNGIDGIVASRVHIVPRREALYLDEQRPASASVFVKLAPGQSLDRGQVRAVVNLVANAVDGLEPERVSVADAHGNLLATGDGGEDPDSPLGAMRSVVEYRVQLENRYERAVSQALLPVLGWSGGFSVTASVDLDLESRETTTRKMETSKAAVVSEVNEEQQQSAPGKGGVPGVDANLPERGPAAGAGTGSASNRTTSTLNYAYPTVDEVAKRPAGGVRRVSVAVQVDEAQLTKLVASSGGSVEADALKERIEASIRAAVGHDESRNDVVTVSYLPFAPPEWAEGEDGPTSTAFLLDLAKYAVALGGLALLFWFVVRPVISSALQLAPPEPAGSGSDKGGPAHGGEGDGELDGDADLVHRLKALVDNFQPIDQDELNKLVNRESDTAAEVLRKWTRTR